MSKALIRSESKWASKEFILADAAGLDYLYEGSEHQSKVVDPKSSELSPSMPKSGEIRMEGIRDSDVQIDLVTWL